MDDQLCALCLQIFCEFSIMAIFPSVQGISISIIDTNRVGFTEYDDLEAHEASEQMEDGAGHTIGSGNTHRVHKFVECSTGQEFGIRFTIDESYVWTSGSVTFSLRIDGEWAAGWTFGKKKEVQRRHIMGAQEGKTYKPFIFSVLETDNDNFSSLAKEKVDKLGAISVRVWRGTPTWTSAVQDDKGIDLAERVEVHEKALKGTAKSHTTSLGKARQVDNNIKYVSSDYIDKCPITEVIFKYRSNEALKQLMIIPRTPEPSPEPEESHSPEVPEAASPPVRKVKMEDLSEEARRKVEELMQSLAAPPGPADAATIKRERTEGDASENAKAPTIKRERMEGGTSSSSSRKRTKVPSKPI